MPYGSMIALPSPGHAAQHTNPNFITLTTAAQMMHYKLPSQVCNLEPV